MSDAADGSRPDRSAHPSTDSSKRRRAILASIPFFLLGLVTVVVSLEFAPKPLWAFLLVPPVVFMAALTYLTFRSDFLEDR